VSEPLDDLPALCVAARAGDAEQVARLLADGAPLSPRTPVGWTALHEAAWSDAGEVVRQLIAAGVEVDARTHDGLTAAMIAAGRGAAEALAALCAHNATLGLRSHDGRTALESALQNGFFTIGLDLVHAGAPLDTAHAVLLIRAAMHEEGRRLYRVDPVGEQAIREGEWLWLSRQSLAFGPELRGALHPVTEHSSARSLRLRGRVRWAQVELMPPEAQLTSMPSRSWRSRRGWTELVAAAIHGERGVDELDAHGFLPILDAVRFEAPTAVEALIRRGAAVAVRPHYGLMRGATLLHNAAEAGTPRTIQALLQAGADVNARTASGWTALMVAASRGHLAAVHALLRAGADMEARNAQGQTAMALAQLRRKVKVARALLVAGNVPLVTGEVVAVAPENAQAGGPEEEPPAGGSG
jgi:serine/threonine-protein phosphatase 6 regulatory ankyrin repeat subunit B